MQHRLGTALTFFAAGTLFSALLMVARSGQPDGPKDKGKGDRPRDLAAEAVGPAAAPDRPEARPTEHDKGVGAHKATPMSAALKGQLKEGKLTGFDFGRDPLGAPRPMTTLPEVMAEDIKNRPTAMAAQRKLLEARYNLEPKLDPEAKMSRGRPLCVGPTARLAEGQTWEALGDMSPADLRKRNAFPYRSLPHPLQTNGGQVFPQVQTKAFPRLERFDVEFDLPDAFLPEFPPAIFLQNRPELGDVSRGQVVTLDNFQGLFKEILTPLQLDGLRLLLTPLAENEFNLTDDRKSPRPQLGVACFDCHVNGHTTGQIELSPDFRPQERRIRLDTPSLRGVFNQQIHGSKRSVRSIKDFSQFEQPRAAYFDGDQSRAAKKGEVQLTEFMAIQMERMQMMFDFPPAPKLTVTGRLDPTKAAEGELRGEKLFFGKAQCAVCHPAPFYTDDKMHDLHLERFLADEPGDGPIKSFTLRGIKDSPPYLHDGRCLTLEDVVEFFNLVQGLKLTKEEKADLVAFLRCL